MSEHSDCRNDPFDQQLITWRRELHQYPELSNQEHQTTVKIIRWLKKKGIRLLPLALTSGVVAEIGDGPGPIVALRADIDALPIEELTDVAFRSQHAGVMHACGHDFHTAVMLGAACLLKKREQALPGKVRILFQPAEEVSTGALQLIGAGALNDVSAIFGLHNAPELPAGTFASRSGAFYANVDRFSIRVTGKGAHAAKPEEGIDSIVTACNIVNALQTLPSRSFSSLESLVISVTRIQGGNTWNVLPQTVELEGTVRTYSTRIREQIPARIEQLINGITLALGAKAQLNWQPGPPSVVNTPYWVDFSKKIAHDAGYQVENAELQMSGEDFALYLQQIPGAFVSIGSNSEFGLHHPQFNPDESAISPAARYFAQLAEAALHQQAALNHALPPAVQFNNRHNKNISV
ncbi:MULTISPECIES: M20 peptidase aminoacylase family protein [Brenneria]|uniref:Amidohydrolase n=1 Tax=Brenneria nigrifluens DSM 30175 = ATCC 13028 TaxID=1121120 RepID=A0A2U1UCH1_9GAMM|nr:MULTISPECIES: M20 peptidase aminoacylase family protein [Brenneria]EHD21359.1 amidohydrolase [Brenneria sp. EniD312]PWC19386.1 amidohydrolase [Brenneria nigrifluens] [Brenneria nigrifluens DSM 30175 = ATCC 13028]PWC20086.1 amidohydrolase [Brenneria nigrifluens] [Brenneria nigrifluens DSM 30175 = ATCC 13028]QCR04491.1 amidohydrolase [Brenneria nigrifluens] [Brenneria nigrifluens DSM 30175 = ATCC 13028]